LIFWIGKPLIKKMSTLIDRDSPLTKQQAAYRYLRRGIMEGRWRPGDRLVIDRLARELEMSAIPVREALGQLAQEGLLELRPHAGAVVSDVSTSAIREIFFLLESLEQTACRLLTDEHRAEVIFKLEGLADQMEGSVESDAWLRHNRAFHEVIPQVCGLTLLLGLITRVGEEWERLRLLRFSETLAEDEKSANREHREFIALVEEGDLAGQLTWITRHNHRSLERYGRCFEG
jgi:DNA-binding GntR family transcriptional regulator